MLTSRTHRLAQSNKETLSKFIGANKRKPSSQGVNQEQEMEFEGLSSLKNNGRVCRKQQ